MMRESTLLETSSMIIPFRLKAGFLGLLLFSLSCQVEKDNVWKTQTLHSLDSKIQSVDFGSLWGARQPCIALVSEDGRCVVLWQDVEKGWLHREVHHVHGGLSAVAIGDADPRTPGPDLVIGASTGQVMRVSLRDGRDVLVSLLYEADSAIGDVAIYDLNEATPGEEIVVCTEDGKAVVLWCAQDEAEEKWESLEVASDSARIRNVVVGPYGPQRQPGALFVGASGVVTKIHAVGGAWRVNRVYTNPEPLARIAGGDVDPATEAMELVLVDDAGLITLLKPSGGEFFPQAVHKESKALRGAAVGEFLTDQAGDEFAVFGYGMEVALFKRRGTGFDRTVLFTDTDRGHWLLAGQILPETRAHELVAVGYSGKVTLIFRGYDPEADEKLKR